MFRGASGIGLFIATIVLAACAVPGVKWVNPKDPKDDGAAAKKACDVELGLGVQGTQAGQSGTGTSKTDEYTMRALNYQEDLKKCMAGKGYQAAPAQ